MSRFLVIVGGLLLVVLLAVGGFGYWLYSSVTTPHSHAKASDYILIEKGTAPAAVIGTLVSEGVIANGTPVLLYLRTLGDASKIKAGEYRFASPISPMQVLAELEKGEERVNRITIPEGFTIYDVAKRLARDLPGGSHVSPVNEADILAMLNDTSLIRDISPEAKNLEGYLYPSTYDIPLGKDPNQTAKTLVKTMVEQFRKTWKPEWTAAARARNLTPHQVVTIASLIETESKFEQERPIVASVINNRLSKGIPLGIDQTNVYIAKMQGRWDGTIHKSDLEVDSPYNTRKRAGLPPGPISNVSASSIEAALNPATTDYIFYVLDVQKNDGSHLFFASAADFERAKANYQRWLEQQRAEKRANTATPQ